MQKIEAHFQTDKAEIQPLHAKLSHLVSVHLQNGQRNDTQDENHGQREPRHKRARSVEGRASHGKTSKMIRLSGWKKKLDRDTRKDDSAKHYMAITSEFPRDIQTNVYGRCGKDSTVLFPCFKDTDTSFRIATRQGSDHPDCGDGNFFLKQAQGTKRLRPSKGTSKACRAFHECGVAGNIENDKNKGEIYVSTFTDARIMLDSDDKPKLLFADRKI